VTQPNSSQDFITSRWSALATGLAASLYGAFFCQGVSASTAQLSSVVSLFDLKARFFVPTHHSGKPSRAGAVKAGRLFGDHPQGLGLDSSEHGGTIECSRG
jgi:hypothetical protein